LGLKIFSNNLEVSLDDFKTKSYFESLKKLTISKLDIELVLTPYGLSLKSPDANENAVYLDFDAILLKHEQFFKQSSIYNEKLARAIGIKPKKRPRVLDATAGLMSDTLLLLSMGVEVIAFERNPLAQVLCLEAIERSSKLKERTFQFMSGDALDSNIVVDVIYFDPMYEDPNHKTKPNKKMRIFRELVGSDSDAKSVGLNLLDKCLDRLVIKRPIASEELLPNPSLVFRGKSTRYDVYLKVK
jgi:16S rRNA (guanine1516-N2)-methyltransferase